MQKLRACLIVVVETAAEGGSGGTCNNQWTARASVGCGSGSMTLWPQSKVVCWCGVVPRSTALSRCPLGQAPLVLTARATFLAFFFFVLS